ATAAACGWRGRCWHRLLASHPRYLGGAAIVSAGRCRNCVERWPLSNWYDQMGGSHARQAGWERKSGTDGPWFTALVAATVAVAGPGGQQGAAGLPRRGTTPGQEPAAVVCGWACAVR